MKKLLKKVMKLKKSVKVTDKTRSKFIGTVKPNARGVVLVNALKAREIPLNREINLQTLKIKGKLYSDLISSRPLAGTTTRRMIKEAGYNVEIVKTTPTNKKLATVLKFSK